MKKLALSLEDLQVDSFSTTPSERAQGTVFGEQCTCWTNCTCPGCPTCDATCGGNSCQGTCGASCAGTCGDSCDFCTWGGYTCDNSCQGGYTCDYTCEGFVTYGPGMECRIC